MKSAFYIEQEKFLRDMFELLFKDEGLKLYSTKYTEECLYLIEDISPDIIIVDFKSVGEKFDDFLEAINSNQKTNKIPFVLTGFGPDLKDLKETDFIGVLEKPISPTGLLERLKDFSRTSQDH